MGEFLIPAWGRSGRTLWEGGGLRVLMFLVKGAAAGGGVIDSLTCIGCLRGVGG